MAPISNAVYATLLMNDAYLPGAMVLGHSLRDKGAKGKLVVLVIMEKLAPDTITELKTVYDEIVPVKQIMNNAPANLYLMNRPDLINAFTKIQLWKQTQYKRIVYIDADVVALRAPNELLTMETDFAAVPDIGWPDCFNSGMMVLNPNMADYYALLALAERGISFDGADQGLLNMHFTEWERLSFAFNCTPSGHYQYVPAYKHFQSTISLVHFIGRDKPWTLGRYNSAGQGVYGELLGRWWTIYDKHYRGRETVYVQGQWQVAPKKVQDYVTGEETQYLPAYQAPPPVSQSTSAEQTSQSVTANDNVQPSSGVDLPSSMEQPMGDMPSDAERINEKDFEPTSTIEQRRWSAPHADWEPAKAPPPANSKPEASNFPSQIYDFSDDTKLFRPPVSYPDAPKDMWYEVPKKVTPPPKPKPIFPWEENAPKPTRVFLEPKLPSPPSQLPLNIRRSISDPTNREDSFASSNEQVNAPTNTTQNSAPAASLTSSKDLQSSNANFIHRPLLPYEQEPKPHLEFHPESSTSKTASVSTDHTDVTEPGATTPSEPWREPYVNPWDTFRERSNAWDDMPEITAYVQALQPPRRGKIQVLHHTPDVGERRESVLVTDFPSANERPSLPVTPAPIRRPTFWGDEKDMSGELPDAKGVPVQDEWVRRFSSYPTPAFANHLQPFLYESNGILSFECQHCGKQNPIAKLDELQRRQSEALMGMEQVNLLKEPPKRELPGSASREAVEAAVEKATSPTSSRPLKPILREPHFELGKLNDSDRSDGTHNHHHYTQGMITEEILSPLETSKQVGDPANESSSSTPTPTPQVTA